jgi:hypothetical protein
MSFEKELNKDKFQDFLRFLGKVNENAEFRFNLRNEYVNDDVNDPALAQDVEYFGFNILQDARMRYIIENIVTNNEVSLPNKICNTVISHFYGARDIHRTLTGIDDVKKAIVDFERINSGDTGYLNSIKESTQRSLKNGKTLYGTTELHTSIQTAGRNFCRDKYENSNRPIEPTDILEWVSSWVTDGTVSEIKDCHSLYNMYKILTSKRGVGEYYGYHCATSNSVNPYLNFNHDEDFCAPGPGARSSIDYIFDGFTGKIPYGDVVIWLRREQDKLFGNMNIHPFFHNYTASTGRVFSDDQNNMKVYGTEVGLCQYGVYCHLRANTHLVNRRKVA